MASVTPTYQPNIDQLDKTAHDALEKAGGFIKDMSKGGDAKGARDLPRKVVSAANQVMPVLLAVSELNSIAKAVVGTFAAMIKLELTKQNNSAQLSVVYYSMTLAMYSLRYLSPLLEHDDELKQNIKEKLDQMSEIMNEFGTFVTIYYKYRLRRLVLAQDTKMKLNDFHETFKSTQEDLDRLLNTRQLMETHLTHEKVTEMSADVNRVIALLGHSNEREKKLEELLKKHSAAVIINTETLLKEAADDLGEKLTLSVKSTLKRTTEDLLTSEGGLFKMSLEGARMQIQESIENSQAAILLKLNEGPHELINDEDVKKIWKEMGWRTSVKARVFVDGLHEYFEREFRNRSPEEPRTDQWALKYLSKVMYHSAIGNAIDEDGSGFISVQETNSFLERRPKEWTVPQWLAYWAILWSNDNRWYYEDSAHLVREIKAAAKSIKAAQEEYTDLVEEYTDALAHVERILNSLKRGNLYQEEVTEEMEHLQEEYSEKEEKRITEFLEATHYRISEPSVLVTIVGRAERVELVIAALLFLLLQKHDKFFTEATTNTDKELNTQELEEMCSTLYTVCEVFDDRYKELLESWKQQKMDVDLQIGNFSNGIFVDWHFARENGHLDDFDDDSEEEYFDDSSEEEEEIDKMSRLIKLVGDLNKKLEVVDDLRERLERIENILGGNPKATASRAGGLPMEIPQDLPLDLADHQFSGMQEDELTNKDDGNNGSEGDTENHDNTTDDGNHSDDGDDGDRNASDNDVDGQDNGDNYGEDMHNESEGDNNDDDY